MVINKLSTFAEPLSCSHFGQCSGCVLQEIEIYAPSSFEEIENYFSMLGIKDLKLKTGKVREWRTRAKLAVRKEKGEICIGLYREGSHQVVSIPHCQVHHPAINQAIEMIKQLIQRFKIPIYEETSGTGIIRYLQLAVERQTQRVQLTLVVNCQDSAELEGFLDQLSAQRNWHSIWLNFQTAHTNTIFGSTWQRVHGEELLWEEIADTPIAMHPACFAQANLEMYEVLITDLREQVPPGTSILEYYAGVGSIGLNLGGSTSGIRCCEINPWAERCFHQSASRLQTSAKLSFYTGTTREALPFLPSAEVLVVDPPRKGLERELVKALSQPPISLKQVCYISCYWPSLRRDLEQLSNFGWHVASAHAYLFFPGVDHVELMVVLKRECNHSLHIKRQTKDLRTAPVS